MHFIRKWLSSMRVYLSLAFLQVKCGVLDICLCVRHTTSLSVQILTFEPSIYWVLKDLDSIVSTLYNDVTRVLCGGHGCGCDIWRASGLGLWAVKRKRSGPQSVYKEPWLLFIMFSAHGAHCARAKWPQLQPPGMHKNAMAVPRREVKGHRAIGGWSYVTLLTLHIY